jgi:hypothetical protein
MTALFRPFRKGRIAMDTLHLLTNLPVGVLSFTAAIVLLSVSGSLSILIIGLPLLMATVQIGRTIGRIERARATV